MSDVFATSRRKEVAPTLTALEPLPARRARKPFGSHTQKLSYPKVPGMHLHWFSDKPGRIMQASEAGYDHVKRPDGSNVSLPVGVNDAGGAEMGFLMQIPEEWYQEDMAAQQVQIDQFENAIKRGQQDTSEGDGRYVPKNGDGSLRISIQRK